MNLNPQGAIWNTTLAIVAMVLVQVFFAASQIMTKASINQGAFILALLTYRHLVAAFCIALLLPFIDRESAKKLTNWHVWLWSSLTALTGITMGMGLFYYGLRDTTATYATNFSNLIPIITFMLSVICRMEKVKVGERWGKLKVVGALLCVGGALMMSLYQGAIIHFHHHHHHETKPLVPKTNTNSRRGTILIVASCVGYALWFIAQVKLLEVLPSKHWGTFLTCLLSAVQTMVLGLCLDHRSGSWKVGWSIELATIVSSGALASAASFFLILWTIDKKGPAYPAMFDPLSVVFVALVEAVFFGEALTIGILLGMVTMIVGLYCYLWGLRDEALSRNTDPSSTTSEPVEGNSSKLLS